MSTPAVIQIRDALETLLGGLSGINIFVDRGEAEPIQESERPAVDIRIVDWQMEPWTGQAEMQHSLQIDLDLYDDSTSAGSISTKLITMVSDINTLIAADRYLGGKLMSFEAQRADSNLDVVPDIGCTIFSWDAQFLTPRNDFNTILGAS